MLRRPRHKRHCDESLNGGIQPLIKSVIGNPMISHYLQVCISYEFELHSLGRLSANKRKTVIRTPLFVNIDVGIEPTKITDFMNLYTFKDEWDQDDLDGMLQFHHFASIRSGIPVESALTDSNIALWKQAREVADEDGDEGKAVALIRFVNNMKQAVTCTITIGDDALETARDGEPFVMGSALTGKKTIQPLGIYSCLEYVVIFRSSLCLFLTILPHRYLNTHIRSDKSNRLFLRAPMRDVDKELIRDAGRNKDSHAAQALRIKMKREAVYVSHRVELEVSRDGTHDRVRVVGPVDREVVDNIMSERIERLGLDAQQPDIDIPEAVEIAPPGPNLPQNRAERRRLEQQMKKAQKKGKR